MGILRQARNVLSKPRLLVGLDIGSSSIKIARLKETSEGIKLMAFDRVRLAPGTIIDGGFLDFDAVVKKIRGLAEVNGCAGAKCAIAVSGHSAMVKKISLPEMTEAELAESIKWEAEQYIPFNIRDVNIDAQILNPKVGQGMMDVLLVAVKKDVINDYVKAAQEAGLCPVTVDIDTFACQNAFAFNYGFAPNEIVVLINVGASIMNVNVVSNGVSVFARDISMGGALVTEEIMRTLNVSWEEAEHYKTMPEDTTSPSAVFREVQNLHERISETLVTEIQRSLDFFMAVTINSDIARIYLSGGAMQNAAFARALERRLEVPVQKIDPFKNIIVDSRKFNLEMLTNMSPFATVAIGLARRFERDGTTGSGDVRLNLIGAERKTPFFTKRKFFSLSRPPWKISVRMPLSKKRCTLTLSVD